MNGNDQTQLPSPELPPPLTGNSNPLATQKPAEQQPGTAEVASQQAELAPTGSAPAVPVIPLGQTPPVSPLPASDNTTPSATPIPVIDAPDVADDSDLIEKEWVNKAKAIVARTKEDPHAQNKEINKFKADYIQKRYNKQLKVNDS